MYQGTALPLDDDALTKWRTAIEDARKVRKDVETRWDWQGNIDRYAPPQTKQAQGDVNVGADFSDVERKKAALFFAPPDISFICDEPGQPLAPPPQPNPDGSPSGPPPPTLGQLSMFHQQLLNELLSPAQLDILHTVGKCVLNVLLPSGVGPVKIGYSSTTQDVPVPDPLTGMPAVDSMTGQPQTVPVSIHDQFYVRALSPKSLLLPKEFKDTDIRQAAWVGYDFTMPVSQFRAEYGVPEDVELPTGDTQPYFHENKSDNQSSDPAVTGAYIEYRSMHAGLSRHPKAIHCLVLVDGLDTPIKHEPSPHQTFDGEGRLTPDSLKDFTILPLWVRDLPDSAWVPSDSTITAPLTREINKYREQSIRQRDNARHVILFDSEALSPEVADKIKNGDDVGTFIPVKGNELATKTAAGIMSQVVTASVGRESYLGVDYIQADRDRILGISANTVGAQSNKAKTATEVQTTQRNSDARFNQEQARVLQWYLSVVRTLDTLVLRYGDDRLAVSLLGPRKGQIWAQFKQALAGGYRYEVAHDSGKYLDAEAQRRQLLQMYQMVRQDPLVNPQPLVAKLLAAWGIDPAEGIKPPEPPQPPPPQVGVSFKGEDFNPLNPQFDLVVKMAQQGGWQITPEDIEKARANAQQMQSNALIAQAMSGPATPADKQASAKHGGPATQVMPLAKKQMDETGQRTGPAV